jgi:hypothetical protein
MIGLLMSLLSEPLLNLDIVIESVRQTCSALK